MIKTYRKGVGVVILNQDNLIFVANRIDMPSAWQMPQGGIDEGEEPRDALFRELDEEIGTNDIVILNETKDWLTYDFPLDIQKKMADIWGDSVLGQSQIWFLCQLKDPSRINLKTEHPEFLEFRWVTPLEAFKCAIDFKKDLYECVLKEFLLIK
ncbi:MAG: RNA pyrophosphohydrolase [Holosporales bacterium]